MYKQNEKFMKLKHFIFIAFTFLSFSSLFAQEEQSNNFNYQITGGDYSSLILPPLDTLLARLDSNPQTLYYDYRIEEERKNLSMENKTWLSFFRVNAAYQYGYLGGESFINNDNLILGGIYQTQEQAQNYFYVGASFSMPLDILFSLGNRSTKGKARVAQATFQRDASIENQKTVVIEYYAVAQRSLNMLKRRLEAKKLALIELGIAEENFKNGKISMTELSSLKHSESVADVEYETTISDLNIALKRLEVICNYKFTIKNKR
ncbi:MAG: TolC family protein [Bacteroidales bacterium]|jgi:outer membrane protein TolC|nr:TolC family protein [Bacteroidales bacterium]